MGWTWVVIAQAGGHFIDKQNPQKQPNSNWGMCVCMCVQENELKGGFLTNAAEEKSGAKVKDGRI